MIDLYCERTAPGLWAEPLNASTNLVFLAAAFGAWLLARRANTLDTSIWSLVILSTAIAIGSALFHTFATSWARLLDEIPILLFQLCFVWAYGRRIMGLRWQSIMAILVLYVSAIFAGRSYPDVLSGSLPYAPALIVMLALASYHLLSERREPMLLAAAAGLFVLSFTFRSLDNVLCVRFPAGTHFLWHILNGVVLYLCMRALIVNAARRPAHYQKLSR